MSTPEQNNIATSSKTLKESVLRRIHDENICPKGKWVFLCNNGALWVLWTLTVVVGAVAFSEAIYVSMHSGIEFYDVTHTGLMEFVFETLPFVWLLTFLGVVVLAQYNMRNTKRGYRYAFWQVIGSSVVFTIFGGLVLHASGVSTVVDHMMESNMPGYMSVDARQEYMWDHPEAGRITGMFLEQDIQNGVVRFLDTTDREWVVLTHELPPHDLELLLSGNRVRLLGEAATDTEPYNFYTCGVLPWMPEQGHSIGTIRELRKKIEDKLDQYGDMTEETEILYPSMRCREIIRTVFHKTASSLQ